MSRYPSPTPEPVAIGGSANTDAAPSPPPRLARLLSAKQAAEYLGVSPNTIRKYRDEGKIRAFHVGEKLVKYDPEDLDRFVREFNS